ncbi:hypothetical protein SAMN05216581_3870 [Pseudomonas asplenii]|uniref:DUF4760 domain-containing protein n=1 Tax=Pseudomonas asplenii TaxID=53407 RepID=A0A1H6NS01_9PSED|nr:hypothetical protein [Pseudomonas fuscovaginae]SEI19103.1 hypothetical protein SAMN05216581_3870 [Pseudomonas fuscovaginae]
MDRVILLGCILLLLTGLSVGLGINTSEGGVKSVRDALELLSFAGTVVTAIVAAIALTSWHAQFRHSERWKAVKKFQESLDGGRAASHYVNLVFRMVANNQMAAWHEKKINFSDDFESGQRAWFDQCLKVERAWQELENIFEGKELDFLLSHKDVEQQVNDFAGMLIRYFINFEVTELSALYQHTMDCIEGARNGKAKIFEQTGLL